MNIVQYDKFQYDTIQIIKGIRKQVNRICFRYISCHIDNKKYI
jgi:hypothetical protein